MSLSRSPSPRPGGGWSSPGLTPSGTSTPRGFSPSPSSLAPSEISWAAAKAKSEEVRGYPSFSTRNSGFFSRQKRRISARLPSMAAQWSWRTILEDADAAKEDAGLVIVHLYRRSPLGGGRKFVIILGSNVEGGVMEWKGAREWAIERNSIWNKELYAHEWGYELEVANLLAKKRYSHEWRESWEKGDVIREVMQKYPHAEWFCHLEDKVYRDINVNNPLNITHPLPEFWLDEVGRSAEGDGRPESINMLLTQDCSGFNLGSFFLRRSLWTDRLLDAWWDPVMYEQMHMNWEHKEQNALEWIYQSQPWIRSSVAFLPQRSINSFPPGACGEEENPAIHYQEKDRDFLVNMAGCMYGRDCWSEMHHYRAVSNKHNKTWKEWCEQTYSGIHDWFFKPEDVQEQE
ncbi:hypothetical protein N7470_002660 [Penicillium chermesinum]|nr:hypothetical protein N7470_002660 [Penicillium chermesinum]